MFLLLFVTIWDTTLNEAFFIGRVFFLQYFIITKKL